MYRVGSTRPVLRGGEGMTSSLPHVLAAPVTPTCPAQPVGLRLHLQLGGQLGDVGLAEPRELKCNLEKLIG